MINWKVTHKENVNSRNDGRRPFKSDLLYGESAQCRTRECTEIQRSPTINLSMNDVFHVNFPMEIRYTRFKGDFVIFIVILLSRSKSEVENKGRNDDFCLVSPFTSCFPFNTVADCCTTLCLADLWIRQHKLIFKENRLRLTHPKANADWKTPETAPYVLKESS